MSEEKPKSAVKELFSHTIFYGAGLFLNRSLSILLLPLYTAYFTTEEMGMYALIFSLWMFINVIYLGGIETSFLKFFIDRKELSEKKKIYSTTLTTIFVTSVIFSFIILYFAQEIAGLIKFENPPEGTALIRILSMLLLIDALYRIPLLLLRAELKAKMYFYLTLLTLVVNLSLNFFFIMKMGLKVEAILYSYMISAFVTFLASIILTGKFLTSRFSFDEAKKLVRYGNKFVYIGIFLILIDQSDRFFLKYYYNESVVGIYQANYRLAAVMSLIVSSFRFSWTPYFLNIADNPDNKKIISDIFTYFTFAGLTLFLFFSFFTEPIVKTSFFGINILNPAYWGGLNIIPIVLLSYLFGGIASTLNAAPFYADKTSYILWLTMGGCAIYYSLNFILIPTMQMTGAAAATTLTQLFMILALYFTSQKIYKIAYRLKTVFLTAALAGAAFCVYALTKDLLNPFLTGGIIFIAYLLTIQIFKILDLRKIRVLFIK